MTKALKKITGTAKPKKAAAVVAAPGQTSTQPSNVATQDAASTQAALDEQKKRKLGTVLTDAVGGQPDQLG